MDSIAEVKVLMSAYSAENGRNPTSINVITKGGGTSLHGQASYYFRNEDLNANSFFSNEAGRSRQEYRYNIGSYSIGGPVVLPKLVPRNRNVFFFFNQEYQRPGGRLPDGGSHRADRAGAAGRFFEILQHQRQPGHGQGSVQREKAFPGKIIPASRLTPTGQAILNMFPMPNFVDPNLATRYNWNYYSAASEPYNRRTETARVDWSPRANWQIFFSGSNNADHQNEPYTRRHTGCCPTRQLPRGDSDFVFRSRDAWQPCTPSTRFHRPCSMRLRFGDSQDTLTFFPE